MRDPAYGGPAPAPPPSPQRASRTRPCTPPGGPSPRARRDGVVDLGAAVERRLRHLEALPAHGGEVAGGVEGVDLDVLVPHGDVVVLRHNVRVQEALGEPPLGLPRRRHVHSAARPLEVAPLLHRAVVVEEHHGEVAGGELGDQLIGLGDELDSDLVVAVSGVGAHHCLVVAG